MDSYLTVALILFGFGAVLLAAEFVLPSGGLSVVGGVTCLAVAVGLILYYGDTTEAAAAVLAVSIGLPAAFYALFEFWKRTTVIPGIEGSVSELPEIAGLERLRGRYGRTVTPMRPSGAVEIDGRRIDAMSEGLPIDANTWVKCVDVRSGRVTVRQVDAPADLDDLSIDGLT